MASIPGFRFDVTGASGSQGLLSPRDSHRAFIFPRGGYAAQDSTGTQITFDSASVASRFAVGDWIQAGLLATNIRQVGAVGGNSIVVSGNALTVSENDRIFVIGRTEPTVTGGSATYVTPNTIIRQRDDDAADLYTNSMITTNSNGLVQGFGATALYDVMIQDGNHANQGYIADHEIGVAQGISVTDAAYFGSTTTIAIGPSEIRHASSPQFTRGSSTGGIQEAIDHLRGGPGVVMCSGITYSITKKVWLHSNVTLLLNGATLKRATGSILNGDTSLSGGVIGAGPYGSNGTAFSVSAIGKDISIIGPGILDGNYAAFTGLTNTDLGMSAMRVEWVDGFTLVNVAANNTLGDGFYFSNLRSHNICNIRGSTIGQWSTTASRNAVSFMNNGDSAVYANQGTLCGFRFDNVGDEIITVGGPIGLNVSAGSADGADFGIEFTSSNTVGYADCSFSNISFKNLRSFPVTIAPTAGVTVTRCTFSNIQAHCDPTLHDAGVIYMAGANYDVVDCQFSNFSAVNINSKDTTSRAWVDMQSATGKIRDKVYFSNLNLVGMTASTRTGDSAVSMFHAVRNVSIDNGTFTNVPGIGISIDDTTGETISNIHFNNVTVDGSNYFGCRIRNNNAANTIKEVYFTDCVMKDCSKQATGSNAGWALNAAVAGSTLSNIYFRGCRSYMTPGAAGSTNHHFGLNLQQSAGTLSDIFVEGCDFSGTQTAWIGSSGTMTNIRFKPPGGLGTAIATAATITIPPDGTIFQVTGSTAITGIAFNPWDNGRKAKLIFAAGTTVSSPLTNAKIGGTFSTLANYSITLTGTSAAWNEDSRSANG